MNILLVGSGGREHALAWAIASSDSCTALYAAPGNAGVEAFAECHDLNVDDFDAVVAFCKQRDINFVVIGPEAPLVAGLSDALRAEGILVFGPSKAAAILEGSKGFMKDLCADYNIPTAAYKRCTTVEAATDFIQSLTAPVVVKADGLAAGKGVIIAQSHDEAIVAAKDMLSGNSFGDAGASIVIEEFLDGEELSYFAISDGENVLPFTSAQDHKRAFDNDEGPNTGGMGAYSPAALMTDDLYEKIMTRIIEPTVKGMKEKGMPYEGVLFAGLMVVNGEPYLIEYNVRFGDPECQPMLMRLECDFLDVLHNAAKGDLKSASEAMSWSDNVTLCVVMAADGYPGSYEKGSEIKNLSDAEKMDSVMVFHAGTKKDGEKILANGGRVLGITASGQNVSEARARAYAAIERIDWPEGFYRRDIAWRALEKEAAA